MLSDDDTVSVLFTAASASPGVPVVLLLVSNSWLSCRQDDGECVHFSPDEVSPTNMSEGAQSFAPSFEAVLQAARRGDGLAFEQLFTVLNRRVHVFARVRGAHDPEGVVNETFLRVFTGLGSFEGSEPQFKAWVFTIARNLLIDENRRLQRRPRERFSASSHEIEQVAPDNTEADVMGRLGTESLLEYLEELTTDQRDVILLRIVSDLTIDTIAEILDKAPGAVKALQRRGFRAIARSMSAQDVPR